jgi:hypothetical protein
LFSQNSDPVGQGESLSDDDLLESEPELNDEGKID